MAAIGAVPPDALSGFTVLGGLALDGTITAVAGVLPAAIAANGRGHGLICPASSGPEAAWASADLEVLAPRSLIQLANHFKGVQVMARPEPAVAVASGPLSDLRDVRGQESAKRALEIAAAGGHNLLMSVPPGAGKSMLASRLPSILPPLAPRELLRNLHDPVRRRPPRRRRPVEPPPFSGAAPLRLHGGAGRRRPPRPAGRGVAGASRRALPGRVARVPRPSGANAPKIRVPCRALFRHKATWPILTSSQA